MNSRVNHEIEHGKKLATQDTESTWGWGTPAGKRRASRRANLVAQSAQLSPGSDVLEIGCGTGLFTELFAQTGSNLIAIDVSHELIKKAAERSLSSSQIQFLQMRFEDYAIPGPFDAIIGSSVLHHLDVEIALKAAFDLLKPGGAFCLAEPNMLNPQIFIERKFRRFFPSVSPVEIAFVRWSLEKLLRKIGFEDIHIAPFDWLHPATPPSWIGTIQEIGLRLEQIPLIREFSGSLLIYAKRPIQDAEMSGFE